MKSFSNNFDANSLQTAFIYQFTKYIKFPETERSFFKIGILEGSTMQENLMKSFTGKEVNGKEVIIVILKKDNKVPQLDIFIHEDSVIIDSIEKKANLIISALNNTERKKSIINFYLEEKKLRFEINRKEASSHGLKVNSRLLKLARIIDIAN